MFFTRRSASQKRSAALRRRKLFLEPLEDRRVLTVELVSIADSALDYNGGNSYSNNLRESISDDGRYVAFRSDANNLVPGDTNGAADIFVRDRVLGTTVLASTDASGNQSNGYSDWASISGNGRYVAFRSDASNLVLNDTNGTSDIFVKDLQTGAISRASIQDTTGLQSNNYSDIPSISDDGRYVAFRSDATNLTAGDVNGTADIFVHDQISGATTLVSVDSSEVQANSYSDFPAISGNGLFVSFYSQATNLVPSDTNGYTDIFVRDLVNGTTERVSVDSSGTQANYYTDSPSSISDDGRYVAFSSYADNLVAGDTNGQYDVFVRDRLSNTTIRASVDLLGGNANGSSYWPSISGNGQFVAFYGYASNLVATDTNSQNDIFLRDLTAGTTELISVNTAGQQADSGSYYSALSDDGRYVVFTSSAGNLDTGSYGYYADNVFVRDRLAPATELISVRDPASPPIFSGNNSSYHSSTSADGRYIAFVSYASNLVVGDTNGTGDIFVRDRLLGTTTLVSTDALGIQGNSNSEWPSISADGQFVAFMSYANNLVPGDTNGTYDVFVKNLSTGAITRASVDSFGIEGNSYSYYPSLNTDGTKVAFWSYASNLAAGDTNSREDVFWHDLSTGITQLVSADSSGTVGDQYSYYPSISGDGRYVAFMSNATNLVLGDTNNIRDIFVKDVVTGAIVRASTDSLGNQANSDSQLPSISQNGRYVSFSSVASNLVATDTNGYYDLFVKDLLTGATTLESVSTGGTQGNGYVDWSSISADGRYLAFMSSSTNLDPVATNGYYNIYYRDRGAGTTQLASITSVGNQPNNYSYEPSISADGQVVSFYTYASLVPEDGLYQYDVYAFSPGSAVLGSLDATLTAGALTVTDISPAGKNNDLLIRVVGANLVISDVNEQFTPASAAATGGTLSPDLKTLTIPLINITSTATILTQGGSDLITVDYAGAAIGKALVIRGGTPGTLPGDKLVINNPSTAYPFVVDTNGGKVDASNDPTLNFSEIEQVSFLDTTARDLPFGQFYARGTSGPDYMLFMSSGQVDPSFRLRIGNAYFPKSGGNYGPYLSASASPVAHVYGRGSNDTLSMYNTRINGALYGEDGDDILTGGYGNDLIVGGAGNDRINGGTVGGDDEIWGDNFDPAVDGVSLAAISAASQTGTGNDQINTFGGNDTVYGQGGADIINTGGGNDYINGGPGNDQIDGQGGDDRIYGGDGNDVINGSDGNDLVVGNDGNDTLYGGNGNDILIGGLGQDTANGGAGGDVLIGDDSNNAGNSNSRAKADTADAALLALLNLWNTLPTPTAATLASLGGFGSAGSDGSVDTLYGNAGADAFFSLALDLKPDRVFPGDLN